MWIAAPTPETTRSIVLLSWSSVKPTGTLRASAMLIQVNSAAVILGCLKMKQLHAKLTSTAATEIKLLIAFHRSVNSVITTALTSGARRMIHGKNEFIGSLKFQTADILHVCGLPRPVESHEDGQAHGNFSRGHRDDKENEDLGVIVRQAV